MDKGKKILFDAYCGKGRHWYVEPSPEDFELAKAEGYMFEPGEWLSHDEVLRQLGETVKRIDPADVANAFLYSLSTRKLEYRSALGSYYYALAIPEHSYTLPGRCDLCNGDNVKPWNARIEAYTGNNMHNFMRYKCGGIRFTEPRYTLFDLQQFLLMPKVSPTQEDWAILKEILLAMEELPPVTKAGTYRQLITKKRLLKSNKEEVEMLLSILGICGILSGERAPCYCDYFANVWGRSPQEHTNDYAYPVNHWRVSDGINQKWFRRVFGREFGEIK